MAFDVLSYVMGLNARKESECSSDNTILEEQTLAFSLDETYQEYTHVIAPAPSAITVGETYIIKWDGTEYECLAQDASVVMEGSIGLGNGTSWGLAGNNEPFIIGWFEQYVLFMSVDSETSHTVGIYKKTESGGSSVGSFSYFEGSFKATAQQMTIEHNCGKIPDVIIVRLAGIATLGKTISAVGFSKAMLDKMEDSENTVEFLMTASGSTSVAFDTSGIENTPTTSGYVNYGGIRNATSTTFVMGGTDDTFGLLSNGTYKWTAICGIT